VVPDACGPLDGCIVPNAVNNLQGGYNVFYGENTGFGEFDINLINTTTGFTQKVAEDAVNAAILKESCAVENADFAVLFGYITIDNSVSAFSFAQGDNLVHIEKFANVPDFNGPGEQGFFGMGCIRFPQGPGNPDGFVFSVTYHGGNTYNALQDDREPLGTSALRYVR